MRSLQQWFRVCKRSPLGWAVPVVLAACGFGFCVTDGCGQDAAAKAPAAKTPAPAAADPAGGLPPGYQPPRNVPSQFTLVDEWTAPEFKRELGKYRQVIMRGEVPGAAEKKLIRDGVRYRLAPMTRPDQRKNLPKLRNDVLSDLRQCSSANGAPMQARDVFLDALVDEPSKLLKNNFVVRLNAVILLAELNSREKEEKIGQREIPLYQASVPLLKVLKDPEQMEAVKIWAVKGLARIAADPEFKTESRQEIVEALVEELHLSEKSNAWYQRRVIEGLGTIGAIEDRSKRPIVVVELTKIMVNPKREWVVRAEAAHSIGRLKLDNNIDVGRVSVEVAHLAEQMSKAYAQEKLPKSIYWKDCFWTLYQAYQPANQEERAKGYGLLVQVERGALQSHRKLVQETYQLVVPLAGAVLNNKPENVTSRLEALAKWVGDNRPKNLRIAPNTEEIMTTQPLDAPPRVAPPPSAG